MQMYSCIQPVYVKDFRCDGSLCHSKCCRGWQIEIDAETYRKYKKLPAGELRSRVLTKLARRPNGMYRFAMEGISCPMLCEDGLCAIQRQFGEDFLSNTCAEFPRRVHVLQDGIAERVLSFACPVAARLAMENPAAMAFEQVALSTSRAAGFLIVIFANGWHYYTAESFVSAVRTLPQAIHIYCNSRKIIRVRMRGRY